MIGGICLFLTILVARAFVFSSQEIEFQLHRNEVFPEIGKELQKKHIPYHIRLVIPNRYKKDVEKIIFDYDRR